MLFSNIISSLTGSVGNGLVNKSSDVEIVREALKDRMLVIYPPNIEEDKLPFHIPMHLR